ncbi:hypothetical protein TWF506_004329 [Arthrobotrys conoides]|uniref:Peptidase S8/S53 domain-containing protein n=1 Tax=Arthrobotrys conoides TaxID=74498 RepID=A0AAN8NA60_9PEZI
MGILCLLWTTVCQCQNNTLKNKRNDPKIASRDLDWSETYDATEEIECVLVLKEKDWNDIGVHTFIRDTLIRDILKQDPREQGIENNEENQRKVYFGPWYNGIGRVYYVVLAEYHEIEELILGKLDGRLGAWLDAPIERRLINRMLEVDDRIPSDASDSESDSSDSESDSSDSESETGAPVLGRFLDTEYLTTPPNGEYGKAVLDSKEWRDFRSLYFAGPQGRDIDIYVVDSGLSAAAGYHQAFANPYRSRQVRSWMKTGGIDPEEKSLADYDSQTYHGTDVTSKIIGSTTGYATKSNVVCAIFNPDGARNRNGHFYVDLLLKIRNAILQKPVPTKSIINLSVVLDGHRREDKGEFAAYPFLKPVEKNYFDLMSRYADVALNMILEMENVIIVTGTGNDPVGSPIRDWPAKRGTKETSNLVVVGNANAKGKLNGHVEAEFVKVYGVAEDITVPYIRSNRAERVLPYHKAYIEEAGISLVIPMITGILATHMSENPNGTPLEAIEKLYKDAYPYNKDSNIRMAWVGPRNKVQKRSDILGSWPTSDEGEDGEGGRAGKDRTNRKEEGTEGDEVDREDRTTNKVEMDGEDGNPAKDKKSTGKTKKPKCSPSSEWRRRRLRRRKDSTLRKDGDGPGVDDIGFDENDEFNREDEPHDPPKEDRDTDPEGEEDCVEEDEDGDEDEDEDTPSQRPPTQPSYWSTVTVAMHFTSVAATPKSKLKPTPKPIYTDAWDGTKHAAVQMTSKYPPVKTFLTPNPTPDVGNKDSMVGGLAPVPQRGLVKPAPRPVAHQVPVLDRKSMLRASTNRFRGYTSSRRHAITYTPEATNNGATATVIYTTVHGGTGKEVLTFKPSSTKRRTGITTTSSANRPVKSSAASTTTEKTTMETSIVNASNKAPSNTAPESPSRTRPQDS